MAFCLCSFFAGAQTDTAAGPGKASFRAGVFYNSHLNYYGRTDSLRSSGVFPVAELWLGQHLYWSGAPVFTFTGNTPLNYAGTVLTMGYLFRDNKWAGHCYIVKPVYRENSGLVQSALQWQATASFSRLTGWINFSAGADIKYSDKPDWGLSAGLDHLFRFEPARNKVLVLDPMVTAHAGTQQFTRTSYRKSGFLLFPGIEQEITEKVSRFTILSYEFSMPVVLALGSFQLLANPAYVIPQNLVSVTGRPDLSERGNPLFYVTTGLKMSF